MSPEIPGKKDLSVADQSPTQGADARPAAPGVRLSDYLREDLVLLRPPQTDKPALVDAMVRRICATRSLRDPELLLRRIREREQGISTTLESGLSLPHARVEGVGDISAALALLPDGIADPKQAAIRIRAILLFFSPMDPGASQRHLLLLRAIAGMFQPAFIDRLSAASSPAQALELIRRKESQAPGEVNAPRTAGAENTPPAA